MTSSQNPPEPEADSPARYHRRLPLRYKTTLCVTFNKTGSCPYGPGCLFAHGEGDLRTIVENRISHSRRPNQLTMPAQRSEVKMQLERPSENSAPREASAQVVPQASTTSSAQNSTTHGNTYQHGAPHRNPYNAVDMLSHVPDCDAEDFGEPQP